MKRLVLISLILIVALLLPCTLALASDIDISGALYYMGITIANNGTATTAVSTTANISSPSLIAGNFANAGMTNVVMRNATGGDIAFMPGNNSTNPWVLFVPNIGANSYLGYTLYTANSSAGKIRYFPGSGGMTSDNFSIGDNFTIEQKGYIDTSSGSNKRLAYKEDALETYISATGNITTRIAGSILPYTSSSDGGIDYHHANYSTTKSAASGTVDDAGADFIIGQWKPGDYYIERGFFFFNTSTIPDDALIYAAILKVYGKTNASGTDFDLTIQNGQPTYPTDPLAATDYNMSYYSGSGGTFSTAGFSTSAYNDIDLSATGLTWISTTGTTKLCVRSSRDIAGNAPTGNEYVEIYAQEQAGTTKDPQLVVYYWSPSVTASGISSAERKVTTDMDSPFFAIGVDNTTALLPVSHDLVFNAPMWQTELNADPFTTLDSVGHSCNPDAGATWSNLGRHFDGADGTIDAGTGASLDIANEITVEAWVYPEGYGEANFGRVYDSGDGSLYRLFFQGASPRLQWGVVFNVAGTQEILTNANSVPLNTWTHFIGTYDGAIMRTYINGVVQTATYSTANTMVTIGANNLYIGNEQAGGQSRTWDGYISEFRIYDKALMQTEVTQNYNATKGKYDGTTSRQLKSTTATVPDNANDWNFVTNGSMPFMEYTSVDINGNPYAYWEWQYAETFTDTVSSLVATPTFRTASSDSHVSTIISFFKPVKEAKAPVSTLNSPPPWITAALPLSGNFTTNTTTTTTFPGSGVIEALANLTGTPAQLPLNIISGFVILALSLTLSALFRQRGSGTLIIKAVLIGGLMGVCIATKIHDYWMLVYFVIYAVAIMLASQQRGVS